MTAPRVVTAAVVLWALGAVALLTVGLIGLTSGDELRRASIDSGMTADSADAFVGSVRVVGVVLLLIGLVIGALLGAIRSGSARARRVAMIVSGIFAVVVVVTLGAGAVPIPPVVAVAIVAALVVASVLAYRPSARGWFTDADK